MKVTSVYPKDEYNGVIILNNMKSFIPSGISRKKSKMYSLSSRYFFHLRFNASTECFKTDSRKVKLVSLTVGLFKCSRAMLRHGEWAWNGCVSGICCSFTGLYHKIYIYSKFQIPNYSIKNLLGILTREQSTKVIVLSQ